MTKNLGSDLPCGSEAKIWTECLCVFHNCKQSIIKAANLLKIIFPEQ